MPTARQVRHSTRIEASAACVWEHITEVDIASFEHSLLLGLLGVPKPLSAEILREGVGGARVAHFAGSKRFVQEITEWSPPVSYAFTFEADPGFVVGHVLDLSSGPFRMVSGGYLISPDGDGVRLDLYSNYELRGLFGILLWLPVTLTLHIFQTYLLRGLRASAERDARPS
jgi:hypothetical protein